MVSLQIKKQYLNEIYEGKKTSEFREFKPFYISRFCNLNKDGEVESFKKIDTVKLYIGNEKNAKYVILNVKGIYINKYENEIPQGLKKGDLMFEIELGKIIEHNY
jgi:competence protein ComGF